MQASYLNALNPYMMNNPMASLGAFPMAGINPMMSMGSLFGGSTYGYDGMGGLSAYSPDAPIMGGGFYPGGVPGMFPGGYNSDQYLSDYTHYMKGMTKAGIETNGIQIAGQRDLMAQTLKSNLSTAGLTNAYNYQYNAPGSAFNKSLGDLYTAAASNNQAAILPALDRAADELVRQVRQGGGTMTKEQARGLVMQNFPGASNGLSLQETITNNGRTDFGFGFWDGLLFGALPGNKTSPAENIAELTGNPVSPSQKAWETGGKVAGWGATAGIIYGLYRFVARGFKSGGFLNRIKK